MISAEYDHRRQNLIATGIGRNETFLIEAYCLTDYPLNSIPLDRRARAAANRKSNLKRVGPVQIRIANEAVYDSYGAKSNRFRTAILLLKEWLNEPLPLQVVGARKQLSFQPGTILSGRAGHGSVYLLAFVSCTVRFFLPLLRRLASTARPFLVAMRERKPCLFARLRRLGW